MTTTAARLVTISSLHGQPARQSLLAASGITGSAGTLLVHYSGLSARAAILHLLADPTPPAVSGERHTTRSPMVYLGRMM